MLSPASGAVLGEACIHFSPDQQSVARVGCRVFLLQRARDEIQFLACLRDRGTACESTEHPQQTDVALLEQAWRGPGHERWQHRDRDVERDRLKNVEAGEPLWRDADHGERHPGEPDLAAHDRGVGAKLLAPCLVREDDHRIAAGNAILIGQERSPQHRPDAKNIEEIRADCLPERALRGLVSLPGKTRVHEARGGEAVEAARATANVDVVQVRDTAVAHFSGGRRRTHCDQFAGRGHCERSQDQAVGDAEHRGVRADADGDRQDGDQREAGVLRQHPCTVAEVLRYRLEH